MSEPLSAEELAQLQADYERALNMPESVTAAKRVHVTKSDDNWWVGFGKDESCQIEGTQNHWRWLALVLLGLASQQDTPYSEDKPTPEPISRLLATIDAKDAEIARLREQAEALAEALEELQATVQATCEGGQVDIPGLEILGEALDEADTTLRAYREPGSPAIHTKYLDDQLVERCITCLERWPCKEASVESLERP